MKRLLLLAVLLALVAVPVSGLSLTFQDSGEFSSYITSTCIGGGCPIGSVVWTESTNGGNSYITVTLPNNPNARLYMVNSDPSITTYAAATLLTKSATGRISIALLDSGGSILYEYTQTPGTVGRYEVFVVGGTATVYRNGIRVGTSTPLAQNPSYVGFGDYISAGTGSTGTWDDLVYGTTENRVILGSPEQGYFLKKDIVNPAASGFCFPNGTIISSYNMTTTWGVGDSNESRTILLQNFGSAVNVGSYTTTAGTQAGSIAWPIYDDIINNPLAKYGYYVTTIAGSGEYSSVVPYIAYGATVAFDKDSYSRGDTATVTWAVDSGGYWDTGTYSYRLDTLDVYGTVVDTQPVTAQTGSKSVTFSDSDSLGVYYTVLIAKPLAGGDDIWMNYDYAELTGYVIISGWVLDAETGNPIAASHINITQGTMYSSGATVSGQYNTTGTMFVSGVAISMNTTATGYTQDINTFTPLSAKGLSINISLMPDPPTTSGVSIGGIVRDSVYGNPLASKTCNVWNTTYGESHSDVTNIAGFYRVDSLVNDRWYNVQCIGSGYSDSAVYSKQAVGI